MFDFRYHVVSLAAVFLALVIGILVGIGLSGRGVIDDAERENLNEQIAELRGERDQARDQIGAAARRQGAMEDFAAGTYPALVGGRLAGANVAVVAVGPVDGSTEAIDVSVSTTTLPFTASANLVRARVSPVRGAAIAVRGSSR